eukprot:TRINITY_DN11993_c0_g1_i10.p1 TRINITY_DN11993_c0_g1~~TRINITY_DN11993_c0_g1_i10.p1  ORF type:complete len:1151 (+),score=343.28 TRINITY_DN11993_c0_g1_i10:249-3701(+)
MIRSPQRSSKRDDMTRGETVATFEAKYHGQVPVSRPQGNDVVMHAVEKIHELRLKPVPVVITMTKKGVYVDEKKDKALLVKVPMPNLSWVCTDPRNKQLFSFLAHEARLHTVECHTFSAKRNGKHFVTACKRLIADLVADGSRAEAEAAMIAAVAPIMPVVAEQAPERREDEQAGELIRGEGAEYMSLDKRGGGDMSRFVDDNPWVSDEYIKMSLGCFKAIYRGGIPVKEIEGFRVVQQAALRVKDFGLEPKKVTLVITQAQLLVVEKDTGDHMHEVSVSNISYSLVDPRDRKHFYFIVNDPRLGFAYCHVLQILSPTDQLSACMAAAQRAAARARELLREEEGLIATSSKKKKKQKTQPPLGVYEVKYLGAVRVDGSGNAIVKKAMTDLRSKFQQIMQLGEEEDWTTVGDRVVLVMTADGIRVVELTTGEVIFFVFIRDVAFSTHLHSGYNRKSNPEHDIFAFIAQDDKLSRSVCHLFKCPPGMARDICKTAAFAFRMCIEELQRNEQENPFQAIHKTDLDLSSLFPPHLIISRRDIKAIKVLGAGQFGTVWLALQKMRDQQNTMKHRAVKLLRPNASEQDQEDFLREAITMSRISHSNLVRLVGVSVNHMPWLVVLEFMRYGDLRNLVIACAEKQIKLSAAEQLHFMQSICAGMSYLASKRLVHMDLACRNCLIGSRNTLKIGDFGLTRPFDEGVNHYKLKPNMSVKLPAKWLSIEALATMTFSEASDVWAAGVVFWEIVTYGMQPYPQYKNKEMRRLLKQGYRLEQPTEHECSDKMYELMTLCWEADPRERITFQDLGPLVQALLQEELRKSKGMRDVGKMLNGGVEKELPTTRQTVVEMYTSFTTPKGAQGSYMDVDNRDQGSYMGVDNPDRGTYMGVDNGGEGAAYKRVDQGEGHYIDVHGKRTKAPVDMYGNPNRRVEDSYFEVNAPEDAYFTVDGTAEANRMASKRRGSKDASKQSNDLYLQVNGKPAEPESSYFEVAAEDDEGSYMQIQQNLRGDDDGLGDVSRCNPLFAAEDDYLDFDDPNADPEAYMAVEQNDGASSYLAVANQASDMLTEPKERRTSEMRGDVGSDRLRLTDYKRACLTKASYAREFIVAGGLLSTSATMKCFSQGCLYRMELQPLFAASIWASLNRIGFRHDGVTAFT